MGKVYVELRANAWAISLTDYENLPTNSAGLKRAIEMPNGTQLEVFNKTTGKIEKYAECINYIWYER